MFKFNKNLLILITLAAVIVLSVSYFYVNYYQENQYTNFPEIKSSDKILIFSPHPDDETLGMGGLIKQALEKNATVLVVEMTNGDLMTTDHFNSYLNQINATDYQGNIGDLRQNETINAMNKLGLNQENIIFLGYPDGGLKPLFENNWDNNNLFHMNNGSNQNDHSPYSLSYESNVPYSGSNVEKNVEQIMTDYKPNMIFYPDDGDYHPDHFATSAFVRYAMIDTNYNGQSYTYLVHHINWPRTINIAHTNLLIPSEISASDADWYLNPLNTSEENSKKSAIYSYSSQLSDMRILLTSFVRQNEFYAVYPKIGIEKVNGIELLNNQMPSSSYSTTDNNPKKGILQPAYFSTTAGIAYDDKNLYLMLKNGNLQNFVYYYHLKVFNGKSVKQIDLKIENNTAEYQSLSKNSIVSNKTPQVQTNNNIMIFTLPMSLFNGTKYIMMSIDFIDPKNNKEIDRTPFRVFQFPNKSDNNGGG
jgi:LmbE family N-acetylglucosaminyl deacetylase